MDWRGKVLLAGGIVLAVLVGVAVYLILTRAIRAPQSAAVVVSITSIPERTVFTAANVTELLALSEIPADQVPHGALRDLSQAVGRATRAPIGANEIIVESKLGPAVDSTASASAVLPAGSVAMAVPVNEVMSVAGAVQPGDRVDIIATTTVGRAQSSGPVTQYVMQDVRVLSTGPWGAPQPQAGYGTVTLVLDRDEALELQHMLQINSQLTLVLRRFDDAHEVQTEPVTNLSLARQAGENPAPTPASEPTPAPTPGG